MSELLTNIEYYLNRLLNSFVSGSNVIKVKDILRASKFRLQFKWKPYIGKEQSSIIYGQLLPAEGNGLTKKIILADPGVGKSTLSYCIFEKIFSTFKNGNLNVCPIHIDLSEYKKNPNFGSKEWVDNYLRYICGESGIKWVKKVTTKNSFEVIPFFILDSLDEYLADCTLDEIQHELNKFIFKEANIISCRTQFYEYYISSSNKTFIKNYENIVLLPWDDEYHVNYTEWYFTEYFNIDKTKLDSFLQKIIHSKDLWELCKIPIRYNMILEILAKNNMNFELVSKLISIYHNYTIMSIKHESARNRILMDINDKLYCLTMIAWHFYDERKIGEDLEKIRFSKKIIKELLSQNQYIIKKYSDIDAVVEDIVKASVLVEESNDEFGELYTSIKFSHKSIQEYFVARNIYETLIKPGSHEILKEIYLSFISQEIDQFFKDYFNKLNQDLSLLEIASQNYIKTYESCKCENSENDKLMLRNRLAKQQIGYNLGHLKTLTGKKFLDKVLVDEKDEFIRRSITIGLSIGQHQNDLDKYVDDLRNDPQSESNKINIGFQLSYFSDQPFNVLQPYLDQGLPKCDNTIKKLIHVINERKNRGSWRIDLYTIIYLSKFRKISINNALETIRENLSHFNEAIEVFKNDNECKNWPETHDAIHLINKLK